MSTQSSPSRLARVRIDAGVAAGVGLGQPEAAEHLAGGHPRQPLLLLLLGAPAVDRVHRQRALHGHEAAQPRVDGLQLAAGDAVRRRGHPRAAVALEVHAEQPELAERRPEVVGQRARVVPVGDVGRELGVGEGAHRVADVALLGAQQAVDGEEVMGVDAGTLPRARPADSSDPPVCDSPGVRRRRRQARLTAEITALSEAVTMFGSTPTPHRIWSPTAHSTYAAARASPPEDSACSW